MGLKAPYWDFSAYADRPRFIGLTRERCPMRLDDDVLKAITFVGGQREDGAFVPYGTAFFVSIPCPELGETAGWPYLVTAKHVLDDIKASRMKPVVRINQVGADATLGALDLDSWMPHPTADLTATAIGVDGQKFDYSAVNLKRTAMTAEYIEKNKISVGEEVAVVGLLTRHFGKSRNIPIVRTGNIAAMPIEPVDLGTFGRQEVYLIESRSIGGLSGSPVFLNTPPQRIVDGKTVSTIGHYSEYLLGVNIGLFETLAHADRLLGETLGKREAFLETMSAGIAVVVPAQRILEILETERLVETRAEQLRIHQSNNGFRPTSAAHGDAVLSRPQMIVLPESETDNPSHKEDFTRLLGAAARSNKSTS